MHSGHIASECIMHFLGKSETYITPFDLPTFLYIPTVAQW